MTTYWLLSTVLVIALFPGLPYLLLLITCKNEKRRPRDLPCDLRHSWRHDSRCNSSFTFLRTSI